jgi:hypothetical protein
MPTRQAMLTLPLSSTRPPAWTCFVSPRWNAGFAEILGRRVDLLPEPVQQPRLQANVDRDRRRAF